MNSPRFHTAGASAPVLADLSRHEEGSEKKYIQRIPRNPLISLDSDERIQGNPRESKAEERGLRRESTARQENPNRPDKRPETEAALVVRPSGLGLQPIEGARGLLRRQANGSGIGGRPLRARVKFGPA